MEYEHLTHDEFECPGSDDCDGPWWDGAAVSEAGRPRDLTGISLLAPQPYEIKNRELAPESDEDPLGYTELRLAAHGERTDVVCPKGEWSDPEPEPKPHLEGVVVEVIPAAPIEREPGWAYGFAGVYRDAEQAASEIVYVDGEPVMPEQPAIDDEHYPRDWDRPADYLDGPGARRSPHEQRAWRRAIAVKVRREVHAYLTR